MALFFLYGEITLSSSSFPFFISSDFSMACNVALETGCCTLCHTCSQPQSDIQVQRSLWNTYPEDPFGGMSLVMGKAWTLYTVQHCGQVRQGHRVSLTVIVNTLAIFGMYLTFVV